MKKFFLFLMLLMLPFYGCGKVGSLESPPESEESQIQ